MRYKLAMILLSLLLLANLTGCSTASKQTVIFPIEGSDIYKLPKGAKVSIPPGTVMKNDKGEVIASWTSGAEIINKKDGRFLSNFYILEVMQARTE